MRYLAIALLVLGCGSRTGLLDEPRDAGRPPDPEECNLVDDDQDGAVDEGIADQSCGDGACARTAPGCVNGEVPVCQPGPAGVEACGGGDEDCDLRVDEGLGFGPLSDPILITRPGVDIGPFNSDLATTSEGLLSFYRISFSGSAPMPNTFTVALDRDGNPTREPTIVVSRPVTNGPRVTPSLVGHAFVYCGRVDGGGDDFTTAALTDDDGATAPFDVVRQGSDLSCGATDPEILWTGERHLVVWTDNRGSDGDPDFRTQLDIADERLATASTRDYTEPTFEGDLSASPRFGQNGDAVLLAWGVRDLSDLTRSELRLQALDRFGDEVGERHALGPPPPTPGSDRADWGEMVIVPRADGFIVYSGNRAREGGLLALEVGASGAPVAEPRYVAGYDARVAHLRGIPTPGGGAYLAVGVGEVGEVVRLDARAELIDRQPIDLPGALSSAWPALAARDGRVFVSWTRLMAADNSELYIRGFGCVP